jgi:hypothetical protein
MTRVVIDGRPNDALSSGETAPVMRRGVLTLPQVAALAVLVGAHLFDYVTFLMLMARHGLAAEANPIVVRIAETAGVPGLTLAKLATVGFAAFLVVLIKPQRRKLAYALLAFGVLAGVVGGVSNVASF